MTTVQESEMHPSSFPVTKLKVSSDGESAGSFDIVGRKLNRRTGNRFHGLERTGGDECRGTTITVRDKVCR